jgi:hypothetical protein
MSSNLLSNVYNSIYEYLTANNIRLKMFFPVFLGSSNPEDFSYVSVNLEPHETIRPVICYHDQEPMHFFGQKQSWEKFMLQKSTKFDNRSIILHSEKNSPELDAWVERFDSIPCYWFSNGALALEWYSKQRWEVNVDGYKKDMKINRLRYKFSCLNRLIGQQRIYRTVFSQRLSEIVDHKFLRLSCSRVDPYSKVHACDMDDVELPRHHIAALEKFKGEDDPLLINIIGSDINNGEIKNASFDPGKEYFANVFCHIVTETLFYESTLHLTEKSLRPFVNRRPFILVGPPGSLKYLQSYGFKTFAEFWDESYDEELDPHVRLDKILALVETINEMSLLEMEVMLNKMNDILDYNFHHFYNEFPNRIISELQENLKVAADTYKQRGFEPGWMYSKIVELPEASLKKLLSDKAAIEEAVNYTTEIDEQNVYDEVASGQYKTIIKNRIPGFLSDYFGFDEKSSKEEILARLNEIFY